MEGWDGGIDDEVGRVPLPVGKKITPHSTFTKQFERSTVHLRSRIAESSLMLFPNSTVVCLATNSTA